MITLNYNSQGINNSNTSDNNIKLCSGLAVNKQTRSSVMYLDRFSLPAFDLPPDEAVQHRLEQVDNQRHLRQLVGARQAVHLVLVALQQVFVADLGFLLTRRQILDFCHSAESPVE